MIDKISMKFSVLLKSKFPNELPELSTINYVHKFFLSNVLPIALILVLANLLGNFNSVCVALIAFAILRSTSGGLHLKSLEACLILSTIAILLIPILGSYIKINMHLVTTITALVVGYYAPSNIRRQTLIPEKYFLHLKIISVLIVASNFVLENEIIAAAFLVQAITLIRLKGGEKKNV